MTGKVYLVGAGPGDYKLLTLKGMECLQEADVIVYDRLANVDYLKLGKAGCEYINVGKASNNHTMPQNEINEVLASKAREGKIVTRLKGGDPYVFGRGGEEGEYHFERNIPFEVVPGITSAIGGLCYAGIPITHRDCASSFHVITGHLRADEKKVQKAQTQQAAASNEVDEETLGINWKALAQMNGTLVFLMGMSNLQKITEELRKAGKSAKTPVALVSWATRYNQSVVTGTLENIYEKALSEGVKPPTLIVVGEVVNLRERLNFFEQMPLFGKRIVVTRTRSQNSQLVEFIRDAGGNALEFPTISIYKIKENKRLEEAIDKLNQYTYLVFTSPNGVEAFFEGLEKAEKDARALAHLKIAVIGQGTKKALKEKGICADIMPDTGVAEALSEKLKESLTKEDYVLLPHSNIARDYLEKSLSQVCKVDEVPVYETAGIVEEKDSLALSSAQLLELLSQDEIDYITFTSSSTVHAFIERIGEEHLEALKHTRLISIGEITSQTLSAYGLKVYKEAPKATMKELVHCMYEV